MTDNLYEALCFLLEDALERQGNILAICRAQGEAARRHDLEYLEARTAALGPLIEEAVEAEQLRVRLVQQLAEHRGFAHVPQSMTELIEFSDEPWSSRLRFLQERFQVVLAETRGVVRANAATLRGSLRVVGQAMRTLEQCAVTSAAGYGSDGAEPSRPDPQPAMIDQKG